MKTGKPVEVVANQRVMFLKKAKKERLKMVGPEGFEPPTKRL